MFQCSNYSVCIFKLLYPLTGAEYYKTHPVMDLSCHICAPIYIPTHDHVSFHRYLQFAIIWQITSFPGFISSVATTGLLGYKHKKSYLFFIVPFLATISYYLTTRSSEPTNTLLQLLCTVFIPLSRSQPFL